MSAPLVTVFGGSGFIGRYVVRALAQAGWRIRVAVRRPDLAGHLLPLGNPGQIALAQANLRFPQSVQGALQGADAVVNLVGILNESGNQSFERVQAQGASELARAAKAAGITRFVQFSAIGADKNSDSNYARSKAYGEEAVLAHIPQAIVLRPSVVFGAEDKFFNRFAALARVLPALPLIGGGETKFQPVYVGDLASATVAALEGKAVAGKIYELGGPQTLSFRQLMEYICTEIGRKRLLVSIPFAIARIQGQLMGMLPKPLLTLDQVTLLEHDNMVSMSATAEKRTFEGLGITPTNLAAIVPSYLYRYRKSGQFEKASAA